MAYVALVILMIAITLINIRVVESKKTYDAADVVIFTVKAAGVIIVIAMVIQVIKTLG